MKSGLLAALTWLTGLGVVIADDVTFNRNVRPILSEHCLQCHGFDADAREADLRLDVREDAVRSSNAGSAAIVPYQPDDSEIMARIKSSDPDLRMPPIETGKQLSDSQIETLRRWIEQGATYQRHWSFEPIVKPAVPGGVSGSNPIDAFVAVRLKQHDLSPAPRASAETLLRRVSLDLTGLPPSLDDMKKLRAGTYEQAVDRLLASPHFGERMAVPWLDQARYADTNGYFGDKPRQIWLWRDWVINAFNNNMPYDQFTVNQLAGDLLPNPTVDQKIATGFNRNHMSNNETGIIDEEYRVEYVFDRVDTTMTTWLGLTFGCAQCHDHKYDPITQQEYYQLFAFFNNVPERGLLTGNNPPPVISVPTKEQEQQLANASAAAAAAEARFELLQTDLNTQIHQWEADATQTLPSPPEAEVVLYESFDSAPDIRLRSIGTALKSVGGIQGKAVHLDGTRHLEVGLPQFRMDGPWTIGLWVRPDGPLSCVLSKIESAGDRRGIEFLWQKGHLIVNLVARWGVNQISVKTTSQMPSRKWHHLVVSYDGSQKADGVRVSVDGLATAVDVKHDSLNGTITTAEPLRIGRRDSGLGCYGQIDSLRILPKTVPEPAVADWFHAERIRGILKVPAAERSTQDVGALQEYYVNRFADQHVRDSLTQVQLTQDTVRKLKAAVPRTLVMQELQEPRKTMVLRRGQYDQPGEPVEPGVPASLSDFPAQTEPNRMGLAKWIVSDDNPLAARVAVNRLWAQCFGHGLVRTMNDFGTQGEPPTHPELLDWLAARFRESGWDVKALLRLIVTSQTYQQRSRFNTSDSAVVDPENRLLARGASFRMSIEMIRDQALAASGLLVPKIGGPSVKPYQPPGLWEEVSYNGEESYLPDTGYGLWRRSLYTFIKRQAPPPTLLLFDGPTREKCTVRRARTNTPLQALVLLNDVTYVEASRALATRVLRLSQPQIEQLQHLWRLVLSRDADRVELRMLEGLLDRQRDRFVANPAEAKHLLALGASELDESLDSRELAAWTIVAHTVFNLDEAITRR